MVLKEVPYFDAMFEGCEEEFVIQDKGLDVMAVGQSVTVMLFVCAVICREDTNKISSISCARASFVAQYSAFPTSLWYVLPWMFRYARMLDVMDAVDSAPPTSNAESRSSSPRSAATRAQCSGEANVIS